MPVYSSKSAFDLISDLISEDMLEEKRLVIFEEVVSLPITSDLLVQGVQALQNAMIPVDLGTKECIDTCGTGGSGKNTINTSTLTAFIVAAAGGKVAKHGNRSASGNCGCFDLLEKLNIRIDLDPMQERFVFEELGIVFLFAPSHHPSLRHVSSLRKQHGVKTIFNLLGPLCNPAGALFQLVGSGNEEHADIIANALCMLGTKRSLVVTGHDGLDEVTVTTKTTVRSVSSDGVEITEFDPIKYFNNYATPQVIEGGVADDNVQIFLDILQGKGDRAQQNLVIINAAHALLLTPLVSDISEAIDMASETLHSGAAYTMYQRYSSVISTLS